MAASNLQLKDARMKHENCVKSHKAALKQPLPDKEHLKETFMKQRAELQAAATAAEALAEGCYKDVRPPKILRTVSCVAEV